MEAHETSLRLEPEALWFSDAMKPQFSSNRIGSSLGPLTKVAYDIFTSPSRASDFSRDSNSSNRIRISILARYCPRQRCAPYPKATCRFGLRSERNVKGSSKASSSLLPDA